MKTFSYEFSQADVNTFLCTLATYQTINFDEDFVDSQQNQINNLCCQSAIKKFTENRTNFTPNEIRMMAVSLMVADLVLKGELYVDNEIKQLYSPYLFSINKLLPIFSEIGD